ncbi:hypothetical protein [Methanomethylophilus alvi]|uniref:hypothetical protein n=1 Tax=Methanomethylophilus alvi TaxID=1291540 RepID=UPI0037DC7B93
MEWGIDRRWTVLAATVLTLLLSVFLQPHYLCHIFAVTEVSAYFLYRHRFLRDLRSGRRKTCGECT